MGTRTPRAPADLGGAAASVIPPGVPMHSTIRPSPARDRPSRWSRREEQAARPALTATRRARLCGGRREPGFELGDPLFQRFQLFARLAQHLASAGRTPRGGRRRGAQVRTRASLSRSSRCPSPANSRWPCRCARRARRSCALLSMRRLLEYEHRPRERGRSTTKSSIASPRRLALVATATAARIDRRSWRGIPRSRPRCRLRARMVQRNAFAHQMVRQRGRRSRSGRYDSSNSLIHIAKLHWHMKCSMKSAIATPFDPLHSHRGSSCVRRLPLRCLSRLRRAPPDRRAGADAPARASRAGLHAHRERRPVQRIHLPRHLADRRQARGAGRLRLGAFERLLSRHVGIQRQLARGLRRLHALQPRVGFLRRLQGQLQRRTGPTTSARSTTTTPARAIPASSVRTPGKSTPRSTGSGSARRPRTASTTTSARDPREEDRRHVVRRLLRELSGRRHGLHAGRALRNPQRQPRRKREHARPRTTTGSSAVRTRSPMARSRASKSARTTAATTPRRRFYTDLTGYNTAKDVGVVYVKKTF